MVSEQGLSVASSVNETFDPSYQKLTFHTLNIVRNGIKINKMNADKIELIRREEEMDRAVYDKSLSAVYNIPDVRVGDVVEYSFTIKGSNPVFNAHAFGNFYFQYGVPVKKFAHRLIVNSRRPLQFKAYGDTGELTESEAGTLKNYEWVREAVPALLKDDMLPSWFNPFPHVQYTDFRSWQEVKSWALRVFDLKESDDHTLKGVIERIQHKGKPEEKIKECIRIAQAEIRYLSFSDGIHGYRPHPPDAVYSQKYGDCKDKSFLLSYLLNRIGIESSPALVSTEDGQILNDILPNPWAFNHCVVQFDFNDSTYWIDPTLTSQVGPLKDYLFPSYKNALVINTARDGLDSIPFGNKRSMIKVQEEYSMDKVGGYVSLEVKSEFYGDEADDMRNYFQTSTKQQIHKNYLNFYARDYSEIEMKKDVEFQDNQAENVITSTEEYLIKNFWTLDEDRRKTASTYARVLSSYLSKPDTKLRTMPLAVSYPLQVTQTIKIRLPEEWTVDDTRNDVESDGFVYHSSTFYNNKTITLRYFYKTKTSFIESARAIDHINKIDEVLNDLTYTIYQEPADRGNPKNKYIIIALMIAIGIYVARRSLR
ncbi:MAG TPA: DUF3857 domain-containing protein [Chryseosolibacter sp.]